jgi:hypothetical protein
MDIIQIAFTPIIGKNAIVKKNDGTWIETAAVTGFKQYRVSETIETADETYRLNTVLP